MRNVAGFIAWMLLVPFVTNGQPIRFMKGADVSWLQQVEAGGGVFLDHGIPKDALTLLRAHGFNTIRLRLWHTPAHGYNDLSRTLVMAKRVKALGFDLFLDLHYSDGWADPTSQTIPAAWNGLTFSVLKDSVRAYTQRVILAFKQQGTLPRMVQFGNEIICGMLWNEGHVCGNDNTTDQWNKLGGLLTAARSGLLDVPGSDSVLVMVHIDAVGDFPSASWFYDHLLTVFTGFDMIGLSYYPWWHGSLAAMKDNAGRLSQRYSRDVILAEVAYPFTLSWKDSTANVVGMSAQLHSGYPATVDGQHRFLSDVLTAVRELPAGRGRGVFYWEPEAIAAPEWGSSWENLALFGFDGEVLTSMDAFTDPPAAVKTLSASDRPELWLMTFPNPFNPEASVLFSVAKDGVARLSLYNGIGQSMGTLFQGEVKTGRDYRLPLSGRTLAGGMYFLTLDMGPDRLVKKVLLSK